MRWVALVTALAVALVSSSALAEETKKKRKSGREKLEELRRDYQPYALNLFPYQPMYFAAGTDLSKSKFQVSFRYQFITPDGELAVYHPWVTGFNLAYTQTSFWNLEGESKPFEDTSYKPEIFFISPFILLGPDWAPGFRAQGGFRHESNGQAGNDSRSTNFIYTKLHWIFDLGDDFALLISPEVYAYVWNEDDSNPDLDEYRGYFDLEVMVAQKQGFALATHYQQGSEGWSVSTDFTYPLHQFFDSNLELYLFAQRFDGYAESLLEYKEKKHATRIGFSLIR
jgi:phospholipase A1